jgi:hypothetical protein
MPRLTSRARRGRSALKRFLYSQLAGRDALLIALGRQAPLVHFVVEAEPPSVYWNFEIRPDRVEALQRDLDCPMPLTRMRCLEGEEPFYCLTLNMYRVSGLANGIRAEWSAFVKDAGGTTRYMVVEAASDSFAVDPIHLATRGGEAGHVDDGHVLTSWAVDETGGRFDCVIQSPHEGEPTRADPEWVEANDYIYWLNGLCDRTFYDSGMANARIHEVPPDRCKIEDGSRWASYLEPAPRHVVVYEHAIEFAMSPWWNVRDRGLEG